MGPDPTGVGSPLGVVPQTVVAQQKMPRSDRLEVYLFIYFFYYYYSLFKKVCTGIVLYHTYKNGELYIYNVVLQFLFYFFCLYFMIF